MEQLAHIATIGASIAAVAAPPAVVAGLVPRVGPGRAFVLGLSSRIFLRAKTVSQRTVEVEKMRTALSNANRDQYVVVAGPKGVGKTCIVETATERTFGVMSVRVPAATAEHTIMANVFTAVTRCNPRTVELSASARRVAWWHRFIFRTPVTIVLHAAERKPTQQFADLDSAARALTYDFGMRVVIDASDNSLPEFAKATKREEVIEVPLMPRSVVEEMPKLQDLHAALKAADLADVVWACVGGNPADYLKLHGQWMDAGKGSLEAVVESFVRDLLDKAIGSYDKSIVANNRVKDLYALFKEQNEVPRSVLRVMNIERPSPDKVLRLKLSPSDSEPVLVPADAAMAIVLRFALVKLPKLKELKEMVLAMSSPQAPSPAAAPSPAQQQGPAP